MIPDWPTIGVMPSTEADLHTSVRATQRTEEDLRDPAFRDGVVALLATLAYGELKSFSSIVADARRAPTVADSVELSRIAIGEFAHYDPLVERIRELGADPARAIASVAPSLDEWHTRTEPTTWLEGLMKVYAGTSIATDFYRECADFVDPTTREIMSKVLQDSTDAAYAERELRAAIAANPRVANRLALWGRRLVGEALSLAQHAAARNDHLTAVIVDDGSGIGFDLTELMRLFTRLTDAHTERMKSLGLVP